MWMSSSSRAHQLFSHCIELQCVASRRWSFWFYAFNWVETERDAHDFVSACVSGGNGRPNDWQGIKLEICWQSIFRFSLQHHQYYVSPIPRNTVYRETENLICFRWNSFHFNPWRVCDAQVWMGKRRNWVHAYPWCECMCGHWADCRVSTIPNQKHILTHIHTRIEI